MSKENEYVIVTEVGTFGDLNIEDPTKRKIKQANNQEGKDIDTLIQESIDANKKLGRG